MSYYKKTQVYFRVKRNAHNGFDACRYSLRYYSVYVNEHKNLETSLNGEDPITQLYDCFSKSCPELENRHQCQLVYHDDANGDNILLETNQDLQAVIKLHEKRRKWGTEITLHILKVSQKKPTDIFSCVTACDVKELGHCLKCYDRTWILYKCSQNDDYNNLCGTCIVLGKHSTEHSNVVNLDNHSEKENREITDDRSVLRGQEKKTDEQAQHFDLEAKIKEQVGAEVRLHLAGIMEELNGSQAGENNQDDGSKIKNRRRSRKKKSIESNNKNGSEEKFTGISSGTNSKMDHLQGKASSTASAAHLVDETAALDVHSLIEHTRRSLTGLLAHFPDDLAFPALTESKNKHVAIKAMEGAVGFTSPSKISSETVLEDEAKSLLNTSFIVVDEEKSTARHHSDDLIDAALKKMLAMGFTDEGGWLTRLLEVKGGDVSKVLNILHIS